MFFYNEQSEEISAETQPVSIVTDGLVLHLDAAETTSYPGTGTTWYDLSGNGNDFTLYNSPASSADQIVFNGVNQYARSKNTIDFTHTQAVSIFSMWQMNTTTAGMLYELSPTWNSNPGSFGLLPNSLGSSVDTLTHNVPTNCHFQSKGNVSNSGLNIKTDDTRNKKMFTAIHDFSKPAPETSVFELDKIATIDSSYNADNTGNFRNDYLYIASRGGASAFCNVNFFAILIYDRALTEAEVQQNYNATKGRYGL